jgi:hypothetical protein
MIKYTLWSFIFIECWGLTEKLDRNLTKSSTKIELLHEFYRLKPVKLVYPGYRSSQRCIFLIRSLNWTFHTCISIVSTRYSCVIEKFNLPFEQLDKTGVTGWEQSDQASLRHMLILNVDSLFQLFVWNITKTCVVFHPCQIWARISLTAYDGQGMELEEELMKKLALRPCHEASTQTVTI